MHAHRQQEYTCLISLHVTSLQSHVVVVWLMKLLMVLEMLRLFICNGLNVFSSAPEIMEGGEGGNEGGMESAAYRTKEGRNDGVGVCG